MYPRQAAVIACATLLLGGLAAAGAMGVRFNATSSMPVGFWRVVGGSRAPGTGAVVVACPPDNQAIRQAVARGYIAAGNCPNAREPLLKAVAAIGGDVVTVSEAGVTVNGMLLKNTAPLNKDTVGRKLTWFATTNYRLRKNEVWLVANTDRRSFDSRYFGPVPASDVIGVAEPIWILR